MPTSPSRSAPRSPAYLGGPATELIPLTARIPIQIDAEAQVIGCDYVLYSSVTQKKGGGFGKMFAAAAPIATMGPVDGRHGRQLRRDDGRPGRGTGCDPPRLRRSAQQEAMEALKGASNRTSRRVIRSPSSTNS